jgi:hypothetical protein
MGDEYAAPTTRYVDLYSEMPGTRELLSEDFTEVELKASASLEDSLAYCGATWNNLVYPMEGRLIWLTPHVFITVEEAYATTGFEIDYVFLFAVKDVFKSWRNAGKDFKVYGATAAHATPAILDSIFRLLATSDASILCLSCHDGNNLIPSPDNWETPSRSLLFPVPGPVLSRYLISLQSARTTLQNLRLEDMTLGRDHCIALESNDRTDLEIELCRCQLTDGGTEAFLESQRRNKGPTKLTNCKMDVAVLAEAVRGNTSLKSLKPCGKLDHDQLTSEDFETLAHALKENEGLVTLDLAGRPIMEESWCIILKSIQSHPSLHVLDLHLTPSSRRMSAATKTKRMLAIVEMLQVNTVILTIHMLLHECDKQVLQDSINPRLQLNLYRLRVRAIKEVAAPGVLRRKLLGLALGKVSKHVNLLWLILRENVDTDFQVQG